MNSALEWRMMMSRYGWCWRACALALLLVCLPYSAAFAHCFVGARFFPATLAIDDPCVADELSLPTVDWFKNGDIPSASEWDVSAEVSKRITEDLGISIGDIWSQITPPGGPKMAGFGDLGRHRRDQFRNRNALQSAHADLLFRQRVRRFA
jgi:hypothetical protein